jgi:hypothetical protein
MANAYVIRLGDDVSYLTSAARWLSAKVTAITDQNNLVLAIVNSDRSRSAVNGGVAVPRRTTGTQTNVWRPY